jgi:hypothetical protein
MEGVGEPGQARGAAAAGAGATVRDLIGFLAAIRPCGDGGAGMIDQLRDLEDLKSAAAALQARIAVGFDVGQRRAQAEAGVPADERGKGVGAQIALARRESPARGSRLLGLARALVTETPRTLAALSAGELNEWRVAPGHPASPSTPPLPGTRTPSPGRETAAPAGRSWPMTSSNGSPARRAGSPASRSSSS